MPVASRPPQKSVHWSPTQRVMSARLEKVLVQLHATLTTDGYRAILTSIMDLLSSKEFSDDDRKTIINHQSDPYQFNLLAVLCLDYFKKFNALEVADCDVLCELIEQLFAFGVNPLLFDASGKMLIFRLHEGIERIASFSGLMLSSIDPLKALCVDRIKQLLETRIARMLIEKVNEIKLFSAFDDPPFVYRKIFIIYLPSDQKGIFCRTTNYSGEMIRLEQLHFDRQGVFILKPYAGDMEALSKTFAKTDDLGVTLSSIQDDMFFKELEVRRVICHVTGSQATFMILNTPESAILFTKTHASLDGHIATPLRQLNIGGEDVFAITVSTEHIMALKAAIRSAIKEMTGEDFSAVAASCSPDQFFSGPSRAAAAPVKSLTSNPK